LLTRFHLSGKIFFAAAGHPYYLPDGDDSIAVVGPARDGTANAIEIRCKGRDSTMSRRAR